MRAVVVGWVLAATVALAGERYHAQPIESARAFTAFARTLGPEALALVLKVNRIDRAHVRVGEALVVPDRLDDPLALSPLPRELPALADVPKLVVISRRVQAFGGYEHGRLVRWGPTSTGKRETPTPAR